MRVACSNASFFKRLGQNESQAGPTKNQMAAKEKKMEEQKQPMQVSVRIRDGEQFFSNESSINFNPNEIVIDFRCITHTHDVADRRGLVLRHNMIILNPLHAKNFLGMLSKVVKDYEARFGEIKKSEALKKAESMLKKEEKKKSERKEEVGTYFG